MQRADDVCARGPHRRGARAAWASGQHACCTRCAGLMGGEADRRAWVHPEETLPGSGSDSNVLSTAQVRSFRESGFAVVDGIWPAALVAAAAAELEAIYPTPDGTHEHAVKLALQQQKVWARACARVRVARVADSVCLCLSRLATRLLALARPFRLLSARSTILRCIHGR